MKKIQTFDIELWTKPEEKERARRLGLDTTHGVFQALKAHLEESGLLPEKFFDPWDEKPEPMPCFDYVRCNVDFSEPEGVHMSIELVTLADQEWQAQTRSWWRRQRSEKGGFNMTMNIAERTDCERNCDTEIEHTQPI